MTMDHRCGARRPLDLEVSIQSGDFDAVPGLVNDISIGGMQVEAAGRFVVHQPVTIEFSFPSKEPATRWPAMVVHAANGSVGLMFGFLGTADLTKMIDLLCAADSRSRTGARRSSVRAR